MSLDSYHKAPSVLMNLQPQFLVGAIGKGDPSSLKFKALLYRGHSTHNSEKSNNENLCETIDKPQKPPVENEDPAYFCMSGLSPDRLQVTPDSRTLIIFAHFRITPTTTPQGLGVLTLSLLGTRIF